MRQKAVLAVILGMALLQLLLLWNVLPLPPVGQHVWRQVTGLAFARNFATEHAPFLFPRQDIRIGLLDQGTVYHEFPLVYWLVGKLYSIWGERPEVGRTLAMCINFLGIFASWFLAQQLGYSSIRSWAFCLFYSFAPLFLYYSTSLLPDLTALNEFVLGVGLVLYAQKASGRRLAYAAGVVFLTLALLTKPSWIFYGLPLLLIFFPQALTDRRMPTGKELLAPALSGLLMLGAYLWQFLYSRHLLSLAPTERAVHAQLKIAEVPQSLADVWHNLSLGFGHWFVEINIGWAALPLAGTGVWMVVRQAGMEGFSRRFWQLFTLSFLIYAALFLMRFGDHDYYLTASLPLAAALSSRGFEYWWHRGRSWKIAALALALVFPLVSYQRIAGRWFEKKQVPRPLLEEAKVFQELIPKEDRVLVVGDRTPLVYLYYLDRKGMVYLSNLDDSFATTLAQGDFRWLLVDSKNAPVLPKQLSEGYRLSPMTSRDALALYRLERVGASPL